MCTCSVCDVGNARGRDGFIEKKVKKEGDDGEEDKKGWNQWLANPPFDGGGVSAGRAYPVLRPCA